MALATWMGPGLLGLKAVRCQNVNLSSGDNDLYTCPTGKRAVFGQGHWYNQSAGSITYTGQVKIGGTYYLIDTQVAVASGAESARNVQCVLEAGDSISVNASSSGGTATIKGIEFDADSPLKQGRVVNLSTGFNTVYTCPSGKTALLYTLTRSGISSNGGALYFGNGSGASIRTVYWCSVASGGSAGTTNRITEGRAVGVRGFDAGLVGCVSLGAGDFVAINVNTGASDQIAFVAVLELPS